MTIPRRLAAIATSTVLCASVLFSAASATASTTAGPALRLYRADREATGYRSWGGWVFLDLGVYLAVTDAPLEIHVGRDTYADPIHATQILPGGRTRSIPARLLRGWSGLKDFYRVKVLRHGEVVRRFTSDFCPNSYDLQRLSGEGPTEPGYPQSCGGNVFTLASVWGIDRDWAASALGGAASVRLQRGRFLLDLRIAPVYRRLFRIAASDAKTNVRLRVLDYRGCGPCPQDVVPEQDRLTSAPLVRTAPWDSLPDLVPLPAFGMSTSRQGSRDLLGFGANVWNRGPAPLVVEGYRAEGEDRMRAYQYFTRDGEVVGRAPVGGFAYDRHDGHEHWHFLQFARYRLLTLDGDRVVRSHKQAFCLAPTDPIDLLVANAEWRPDAIGFSRCGGPSSIWIRETMPTGWGDTYYQGVFGQAFTITDVPNGSYLVEISANPAGLLHERNERNNVVVRRIELRGTPGARTVRVFAWHGITE